MSLAAGYISEVKIHIIFEKQMPSFKRHDEYFSKIVVPICFFHTEQKWRIPGWAEWNGDCVCNIDWLNDIFNEHSPDVLFS